MTAPLFSSTAALEFSDLWFRSFINYVFRRLSHFFWWSRSADSTGWVRSLKEENPGQKVVQTDWPGPFGKASGSKVESLVVPNPGSQGRLFYQLGLRDQDWNRWSRWWPRETDKKHKLPGKATNHLSLLCSPSAAGGSCLVGWRDWGRADVPAEHHLCEMSFMWSLSVSQTYMMFVCCSLVSSAVL